VLHVGKFYPPFAGGMENFLGDLMPALSRQGIDVQAVVHQAPGEQASSASMLTEAEVYRVPCYGSILYAPVSPGFPLALNQRIKLFKPDLIHFHVPNTSAFWALLSARARSIPWVIHWHADVVSSAIDRRLAVAYSLYRPFEQRLLARAVRVITTSKRYLDSSIPLAGWQEKCQVIPLGLNPDRLPIPRRDLQLEAEKSWGEHKKLRVLSIGRLTYYKGHEVLIRAVAGMEDVQAIIVGDGDRRTELEKLITELRVQDRVTLTGLLSEEKLQALLASSDCCCLPSLERTEAFGLVLLEAMCYGKPVIVADVPGSGMGWVVEDEKTGLLFKVGEVEALVGLLDRYASGREERLAMGRAGRERFADTFHIDQVAKTTGQLYDDVLSKKL
jgi:rhamnosyl/mannosyltransferase